MLKFYDQPQMSFDPKKHSRVWGVDNYINEKLANLTKNLGRIKYFGKKTKNEFHISKYFLKYAKGDSTEILHGENYGISL